MIQAQTQVRVRYSETDAMGFVYHGSYFPWFETARIHLLDELGLPYREIEAQGYYLPVLEARAQYVKPARFDDVVEITARIAQRPRARIRIEYEVRRNAELLATGQTEHAFIDREGHVTKPPAEFQAIVDRWF